MKILQRRNLFFILSGILIIPGIIGLFVWGLRTGIDFKGGTLIEVNFPQIAKVETGQIKQGLTDQNLQDLFIQSTGPNTIIIKTDPINEEQHKKILATLTSKVGENKEIRFENVGPTIGQDVTRRAIYAIIGASIGIILYLTWAFRTVPKPISSWRFGLCAVIALLHDILFIVGLAAILGHFIGLEVDSLFITAILTIMGFSVHDTIVVFDRIRENLKKSPSLSLEENMNNSIIQTLSRSLNTSLTVLIVLFVLYLMGGESIHHFVLILLLGILIGTYSSIFNATPLLYVWQNWSMRRKSDT
jgi:preprotein translocase subunit SecF